MKSIQYIGALTLILVISAFAVYAQNDPAAKTLLDRVGKKYEGYETIHSDFTFTASQQPKQQGSNYVEKGTLYLQAAAGKYHIGMTDQVLISDGTTQWTVLKKEKEVQVMDADNSDQSISPANIFTFFNKGYKYVMADDERDGSTALHVIELSPEQVRNSPYFKIKLRINKTTNLIHDVTIFDKGSNLYTYKIDKFTPNPTIAADKFTFNKSHYAGMEVVDLR